jgi:hypothetical protein
MRRRLMTLGALGLVLLLVSCVGLAKAAILTVTFTGMEPNLGQRFEARLFDQGDVEVARDVLGSIADSPFSISFAGVVVGEAYRLQFYADVNGNGVYDAPPADQAWEMQITVSKEATAVTFTRTDSFTDIGWSEMTVATPAIDGVIMENEYAHFFTDAVTGIRVYWSNDEMDLTMGLVSPGTGWVAVGFEGSMIKLDANIIQAAVAAGELTIQDQFGTDPFSHSEDAEQDILEAAGAETDGDTVVEFSIPLDSGDAWDRPLLPGNTYSLLLAYNESSDDLASMHSAASTTQFTLDP